jgi:hypothetical protein
MSEQRINPETGVIEEKTGIVYPTWDPKKNENGNPERVNPETGVIEEETGIVYPTWDPKK